MSASRPDVRLTAAARRDYARIILSSQRTWGDEQSVAYRSAIAQAIDALRDHPQIGRQRFDLFVGCRSVRVQQHVIYYHQPRANAITIVRILHRRQDASTLIGNPRLSE
jgi:toxin ParE1/3/4